MNLQSSNSASPLHRLLARTEYASLLERLRRRLEQGRPLTGKLTIPSATAEERNAIEALIGRRPRQGAQVQIDLDQLQRHLREAGLSLTLEEAVIELLGPIENRQAIRQSERDAWRRLFDKAEQKWSPPLPPDWLTSLRADGILKRLTGKPDQARQWLQDLVHLAENLPASGEPLPSLAARLYGDSHALDPGRPLGTLAQRLAKHLGTTPDDEQAENRRAIWASVGVLCDELSAPALVFNLPSASRHFLGNLLREARDAAEPIHLSLRLLLRHPLHEDTALSGTEIFVCENPAIVALAAARFRSPCLPLVCINGQAATPAQTLLRQLVHAGARLRYHGDFDWPGLVIARLIYERFQATPWRFNAADYQAAPKGAPLQGKPTASPWDPALAEAMHSDGRAVHEESVADLLLDDL